MFRFPFGTTQELNLDWFLEQWEIFKQEAQTAFDGIDHALDDEIQRVEDAMTDLYAARDAAIAAKNDALDYAQSANSSAIGASQSAQNSAASAVTSANQAASAAQSAISAQGSATSAGTSAGEALSQAQQAEAWATGEIGGVTVPPTAPQYNNNSEYYEHRAENYAIQAGNAVGNAQLSALAAEGYAKGTRNGTPVEESSQFYHANAKYYAESIAGDAAAAAQSASDAAASAASVGQSAAQIAQNSADIDTLTLALSDSTESAYITPELNKDQDGIIASWEEDGRLKIYGTSNLTRRLLCLNGQNQMATSTTPFSKTLEAGVYDLYTEITGHLSQNVSWQYTYTTFANMVISVSKNNPRMSVNLTNDAMVGLSFATGIDFGTSDDPTYISFSATKIYPKDTNGWISAIDTSEAGDETLKTDMTPAIMTMLNKTGYCHLGEGIFYVSGIDMPVNSTLVGCGRKTVVRLLSSVSSGYCVKMQSYNTVSNILFRGASSIDVSGNEGTRTAILFAANHDGEEGETASDSQACMINNVWIEKFSDSGLKCHNTSINVSKGLYAVNLYITNCWAGINIDYLSEYNKFSNVCTYACKYGCINNSGNNVFTACTFHATHVGFYIDGTQPNSAHGQINGCTFCHIGSNAGSAITIENAANGFIVNDCQIWYCSVDITSSDGIIFTGCEFGRGPTYPDAQSDIGAKINVTGGNLVMFTGCVFLKDSSYPPSITITNNTKTKFNSCYGGDTGNAIAA